VSPVYSRSRQSWSRLALVCRRGDAGTVTAETAVVLPVLLLVTFTAMTGIRAAATELACQDAARAAARAAARGEPDVAVRATGRRLGPAGSAVSIQHAAGLVRVTVRARVGPFAGLPLPAFSVSGTGVADPEEQP
jgi:Flp pilus assembly protein TadG